MSFTNFLIDRLFSTVSYIVAAFLCGITLWLIEVRNEFILLVELIFGIAFLSSMIWDYFRKKKYYQNLWNVFDSLDDKTLLAELLDSPMFLDGKTVYQVLRHTNKFMSNRILQADATNQEYREYIEMWIHEVKTPITSAHLIIENDKNMTTLRIDDEIHKIEQYVEQALFYARSTALEKDFKLEKTTLKKMVHKAVKSYSKQIIQANGTPKFENLDIPVSADEKWCIFIIGQIIANSVKYCKENLVLTFRGGSYENGSYLLISDNGIGISETDISRIFEKGFTGENGHKYRKSTGIGLYLCRKLCQKMNMSISAESTLGNGTTIKITFPKGIFYFE